MVFSVFCAADVYGCKWNLVVEFPSHPRSLDSFHSAVETTFQYECQKFRPAGRDPWEFNLDFVSLLETERSAEPGQVCYYPGDLLSAERLGTLFDGVQVYIHQAGVPESCGAVPPPRNSVTWPLLEMFGFEGPEAQMIPALFFKFDTRGTATVTRETMAEAFPGDATDMIDFVFKEADPRGLGYITFGSWLEFAQVSPRAVYAVQNEWMWQRSRLKQDESKPKVGSPRKRPAPGAEAAPFAELKADPEPTPSPQPIPPVRRVEPAQPPPQTRSRSADTRQSIPHQPPARRWGLFGSTDLKPNASSRAPPPHIARQRVRGPGGAVVGVGTRGRRSPQPQPERSPKVSPRVLRQAPDARGGPQRSPRATPVLGARSSVPNGIPVSAFGAVGAQPRPHSPAGGQGEGRTSAGRSRSWGQALVRGRQQQRPPQQRASTRTRSAPIVSHPASAPSRPWQSAAQRRQPIPTPFGGGGPLAQRRGSATGLLSARGRAAPQALSNGLTRQPLLASNVRSDLRNAASIDVMSLERRLLAQEEVWLMRKGPARQSSPNGVVGHGRVSPRPRANGNGRVSPRPRTVGSNRSASGSVVSAKTLDDAVAAAWGARAAAVAQGELEPPVPAQQPPPREDTPPRLRPRDIVPPLPAPSVSSVPSPRGRSPQDSGYGVVPEPRGPSPQVDSGSGGDAPEPQQSIPQPTPPERRAADPSPVYSGADSPPFFHNGGSPTFLPFRPRDISPPGQTGLRRPESPLCVLDREFARRRAWESRETENKFRSRAGMDWSPQRMRTPERGDGSMSPCPREIPIAESP
eukprot:Hpha_TRINITY_DN15121_c0_g2::TRINITY_DN15121_c0_g2_i1::g.126524::m.126524